MTADYNYVPVIDDVWCDRLGIPRGTEAQALMNAVWDEAIDDDSEVTFMLLEKAAEAVIHARDYGDYPGFLPIPVFNAITDLGIALTAVRRTREPADDAATDDYPERATVTLDGYLVGGPMADIVDGELSLVVTMRTLDGKRRIAVNPDVFYAAVTGAYSGRLTITGKDMAEA